MPQSISKAPETPVTSVPDVLPKGTSEVEQVQTSKSANNPNSVTAKENNVIKIIQKEWDKEIDRLDAKKNGQYKSQKQTNSDSKHLIS
jgi:hypothetical protein